MKDPILVDTSVWINFFRENESKEVEQLTEYLENDWPIYLCPTIIQEILQGIGDEVQFNEMVGYLLAFELLIDDPVELAVESARLYQAMRKQGRQIRKSNDCLIACQALKHGIKILHQDRDFRQIVGMREWGSR